MQGIIPPNINYNKNISDGYQIRPYTAGETCIHNNTLYKAKQDITVAEEWNPEHWEETTVEQELSAVNANIANITPDDTAVGSKPWTSKHIVDMLCPPLEVSGNPVQCYPVPGYPLGITASWEPVQEGTGDPSPDNIRPIKGRDSVTVERCGKNLLKTSGAIWNSSSSGYYYFTRDTADKEKNVYVHLVAGVNYTLSATGNNNVNIFAKTAAQAKITQIGTLTSDGSKATCTFSVDEDGDYTIWVWYDKPLDIPPYNNPMLCIGEPPTEYVPYQGNTVTLTLPETIYGGSVDAVTGEGQKEWNIINLNDSIYVFKEQGYYVLNIPTLGGVSVEKPDASLACCSHYPPSTKAVNGYGFYMRYGGNGFVIFDSRFSTSEELRAYFAEQYAAGTPVQIAYKLNTPTSFSATENEPVKALSGVNTVLTDADTAEVTGREDLIHAIAAGQ